MIIRVIKVKTTVRYYIIPVRMVITKKSKNKDDGKVMEQKECLYTVGRYVNYFHHCSDTSKT